MRKRYILLKNTPELRAGAILEEQCDDGDQDFSCINFQDFQTEDDQSGTCYSRAVVMRQPEWFEELVWLNIRKSQLDKVKRFMSGLIRPQKKAVVVKKKGRGRPKK